MLNLILDIFKKKTKQPKRWREYVGAVTPFLTTPMLTSMLLSKANELGLQGKKITVTIRLGDEIWFEGDVR